MKLKTYFKIVSPGLQTHNEDITIPSRCLIRVCVYCSAVKIYRKQYAYLYILR